MKLHLPLRYSAGWLLKIKLHPVPARSWRLYLDQAALVGAPGWISLLFIFIGHAAVLLHIGRKPLGGAV